MSTFITVQVCVEYFNYGNSVCEGGNVGVYIPSDDGGTSTAEETCCEDLPGGAFYDIASKICTPCPNGKYIAHIDFSHYSMTFFFVFRTKFSLL